MLTFNERTTRVDLGVVDVVVLSPVPRAAKRRGTTPWRVLALRRAVGVRCSGSWEIVHGRIEPGENPAAAARREVREETGLETERLYSVTVNPFYLHATDTVQLAMVFAAVVRAPNMLALSPEHDTSRWCASSAALRLLCWPREHEAVRHAMHLLRSGDGGAAEDVLRVP